MFSCSIVFKHTRFTFLFDLLSMNILDVIKYKHWWDFCKGDLLLSIYVRNYWC